MTPKFMPILFFNLYVSVSIAYPGQNLANGVLQIYKFYKEILLICEPNVLLDNLYLEYFLANENSDQELLATKIKIYTHFYMLKQKIMQNKKKLQNLRPNLSPEADKRLPFKTNKSKNMGHQLNWRLKTLFTASAWLSTETSFSITRFSSMALCRLLQIKFDLLNVLNLNERFLAEDSKEMPKCQHENAIFKSLSANGEKMAEWILSDLMHFLPARIKLLEFLKGANQRNNAEEIKKIRLKFLGIVGISRFSILADTYSEKIQLLAFEQNTNYVLLYEAFFNNETKLGKWRTKIVLQKKLYDEWAKKFFGGQIARIDHGGVGEDKNNNWPNVAVFHAKINFIMEIKQNWFLYSEKFWINDKEIEEKIDQFSRRNKSKNLKMIKGELLAHCKKIEEIGWHQNELDFLMLWENGPEDINLFRALTICTRETVADYTDKINEYSSKFNNENLEELSLTEQLKMLICMSNHLKKSPRKDGIVAKLHIEKIEELFSGEGGHTFRPILTNHKKMWEQFLDADGLNKRRQMLAENEYFSANDENLPSFDDLTSSAEEKDEFEDANLEQYFQQEQIKHQIMEENNENIFHENKLRTKWKNKTKNYYGKKEKRKENLSAEKLAETGKAKVTNYQTKAQKYLKISKNKERNKKN